MKRLPKHCLMIKINASFIFYCAVLFLIDGPILIMCVILTLFVHEGAHLLAGYLLHESFSGLELTPFGGLISYDTGQNSSKGIKGVLIAGAGPAANYAFLLFVSTLPISAEWETFFMKKLISVNISMLLLNLLPVLPLDGGRIVFNIGYYLFPVEAFLTILSALGRIAGCIFLMLAVIGTVLYDKINISLIIVGVYVFIYSGIEKKAMLIENQYTVLQEKVSNISSIVPAQLYLVHHTEPLLNLLQVFCRKDAGVYVICGKASKYIMTEDKLIHAFLKNPCSSVGEADHAVAFDNKTF